MQITTDHLIAELKDQWFARWFAEKQAALLTVENQRLQARLDKLNTDDTGEAGDAG